MTQEQRQDAPRAATCARTQTRREACACGTCAGRSPDAKYGANKRDVLALLDLIESCVDCHPSRPFGATTWGHVDETAHLRARLMEIAVGFGAEPDGDEQAARRRIEKALCREDKPAREALIYAMYPTGSD